MVEVRKTIAITWLNYDVIVVGSGGAGAHAAHAAASLGSQVLVVSKDPIGASDTKISEGIATVRASGAVDDSETELSTNLQMAGGDLPLRSITNAFAADSEHAYDLYRVNGLRPSIDTERNKPLSLPLPLGGHTKRRSVGHENCGVAFSHANWQIILQGQNITYIEDAWFLDLAVRKSPNKNEHGHSINEVVGGLIYHAANGELLAVRASAIVLAAGGVSTLYFPKTDTMRGNTGDSYAIAARAGAELVDMEQLQFLPFCLASPPSYEGLLAGEPVTASFLGVLRDKSGKVILDGVYLRTRAECSAAIMRAVEKGDGTENNGAFLDMTANKKAPLSGAYFEKFLATCLPSAYQNVRQALSKKAGRCEEPWEVRPAAHYMMGGIRVDADGASVGGPNGDGVRTKGIKGLFAAGQSMGGLFGANRLGSTSLTEGAVFGARAGRAAAAYSRNSDTTQNVDLIFKPLIATHSQFFGQNGTLSATAIRLALQEESWNKIGPVRTARRLQEMETNLKKWRAKLYKIKTSSSTTWNQSFIDLQELRNMLDAAGLILASAYERTDSLGGHVRLDGKQISSFATPYSVIVRSISDGTYVARRVIRPRTALKKIISYKIQEQKRLLMARWIRLLPKGIQDKILLKRYQAIMGEDLKAQETFPGAPEAAIGELTKP
ncbi:MAG: hypothetical protein CMF69_03255 [Magnetovibrio sp.]|nr:hypothetical protein [Magnetovibrio sp.]